MYEVKKTGKVFTCKFVGNGPSSCETEFTEQQSRRSWDTLRYTDAHSKPFRKACTYSFTICLLSCAWILYCSTWIVRLFCIVQHVVSGYFVLFNMECQVILYCSTWSVRLFCIVQHVVSGYFVLFNLECQVILYCSTWSVRLFCIVQHGVSGYFVLFNTECQVILYCSTWSVRLFCIVQHGVSGYFCATLDTVLQKKPTVAPTVKRSSAFCRSSGLIKFVNLTPSL
jgi:hypothetical protein